MTYFRITAWIIGLSQLALGALYLFAPGWFIAAQGLGPAGPDLGYPLAMLAARFLVYGVGMFVIARNPHRYAFWLYGMIAIQALDLAAGIGYVATGIVAFENAMVPMVNAGLFILALGGFGFRVLRQTPAAGTPLAPATA